MYVGNLPRRVSADDLRELFNSVAGQSTFGRRKGGWLGSLLVSLLVRTSWGKEIFSRVRKFPQTVDLSFTMVDVAQNQSVRYCRVSGYSQSLATQLMEQLAGVGLQGCELEVRPFFSRVVSNDRRRAGWHFRRWLGVEYRQADRRLEK